MCQIQANREAYSQRQGEDSIPVGKFVMTWPQSSRVIRSLHDVDRLSDARTEEEELFWYLTVKNSLPPYGLPTTFSPFEPHLFVALVGQLIERIKSGSYRVK